jgi:hypothetical protein
MGAAQLAAPASATEPRTDRDATDPVNRGVRHVGAMSDNDGLPIQDEGQGLPYGKPLADADGADPLATGGGYQACNDRDDGPRADRRGFGRACMHRDATVPTLVTDTDHGPKADHANYGRNPPADEP